MALRSGRVGRSGKVLRWWVPSRPSPSPRVRRWLLALGRALAWVGLFMVAQVLFVRFVTPPLTWTMVERVAASASSDEGLSWVDYRPRAMDDLGEHAPRMVVASEDGWFWWHAGFDLGQLSHAVRDAARGEGWRGASTLSQQVARNAFLWQGSSTPTRALRKALEVPYTALLELLVPKERILELYLNIAETGPMVFGFEAGARHHFGKGAAALTAPEAARLVAVLPSPQRWDPGSAQSGQRASQILDNRVPFPGEAGYADMGERAWRTVGLGALWR
jgi:monofunctional biosynthetic peptidoglycan transglycosylase